MDIVFIEDLRIETVIGIYDWERNIRQTVALDVEMAFDNTRPAASDRIADTLDYKAVAKRLIAFVEGSRFELVETLAERCAAAGDRKTDELTRRLHDPVALTLDATMLVATIAIVALMVWKP